MLTIVRCMRLTFHLALLPLSCLPLALTGCTGASAPASVQMHASDSQHAMDEARAQMDLIPPPSKTRYLAVKSLTEWENPYITVQSDMATIHVTIADANPSDLGKGGLLRPVGARRQEMNVRLSDLAGALNAVPSNSWPYGRVVAVEEAHQVPPAALPQVRRSSETVMKTLNDLGVVVYEWPEAGFGLR